MEEQVGRKRKEHMQEEWRLAHSLMWLKLTLEREIEADWKVFLYYDEDFGFYPEGSGGITEGLWVREDRDEV